MSCPEERMVKETFNYIYHLFSHVLETYYVLIQFFLYMVYRPTEMILLVHKGRLEWWLLQWKGRKEGGDGVGSSSRCRRGHCDFFSGSGAIALPCTYCNAHPCPRFLCSLSGFPGRTGPTGIYRKQNISP